MKIKLISDLHVDINSSVIHGLKSFKFISELEDVDYLLIAGDISGSYKDTHYFLTKIEEYIRENNLKTKVIVVCGNHESYASKEEGLSRSQIISKLREEFKNDIVKYCENDVVELDNNTILFGCCLYTNFGDNIYNEKIANKSINDFRFTHEYDVFEDKLLPVKTSDYIKWNLSSINRLQDVCENNKNKSIIVLSHFTPSFNSISPEYVSSVLNPFYANRLDKFIEENNCIIYWLHGHVHDKCEYNINQCKVLCNPMGYTLYDISGQYPDVYSGVDFEI